MSKKQLSQQVSVHALMLMGYDLVMLAIVSVLLLVVSGLLAFLIRKIPKIGRYLV